VIHRLPIPTPFMVGRVNCYLIEDDPLTLVDTGPNSGKALDELERALAAHGRRVEDLERIVVTHQHIDHTGLLSILARRSGAETCALDVLVPFLADYGAANERDDELAEALMLRHGIPRDVVMALRAMSRAFRAWGSAAEITLPLTDGGTLEFGGRSLRVHHRPGHSPSDTIFHDEASGVVLGGDHLLDKISSVPLISRALGGKSGVPAGGRPRALLMYLRSLRETQAMEGVTRVLPGHGDDVIEFRELIDARFALHERRARKIGDLVAERPRSAHEIAHDLWGNVAVTQAYLTLSEVLGHLDLLAERGEVREAEAGGVARWEAVA
jgi:glyoxylase-like metal-dependent hydrolase (beta-lactamase superfamily II)